MVTWTAILTIYLFVWGVFIWALENRVGKLEKQLKEKKEGG